MFLAMTVLYKVQDKILSCGKELTLPNDKFLGWSKLKAFADGKINMTKNLQIALGRLENIVGKRENAGYEHFLLYPQCKKGFFLKVV